MNKILTIIVAGLTVALVGCSTSISLYPVEGPHSTQQPLPVVTAKADGITRNSGKITMTMPDGESCEGKWSSVAPQVSTVTTLSLFDQYGSITGTGMTTGPKPGVNRGEAFLSCSRGTTVEAEFYTGSGTANGYGVARDSNSNVYKMLF